MSRGRSLAGGALLALVSTLLTLAALEGIARMAGLEAPSAAGQGKASPAATTFRQDLPRGPKPEGEFRIVALGDSYTWGYGIEDGRLTWPALLEEDLARHGGPPNLRVVNLGVPGFTTVNELELLRRIGMDLAPDLVVVQYLINDVLPSDLGYRRQGEEWLAGGRPRHLAPVAGLHAFLSRHSVLYPLADGRFAALQGRFRKGPRLEDLYYDGFPGWRDMKKALAGISALAAGRGAPTVFVIFPTFLPGQWTTEGYPHRAIFDKVAAAAGEAGMEVLDLLPAFVAAGRPFEQWWVHPADPHPSAEAHALAAGAVGEYLREKGLPAR